MHVLTGLGSEAIMKISPPIIFAFFSWTIYHYLQKSYIQDRYSWVGLLLFSSSIASLRLSWDHPKQVLGFAWLMLALVELTPHMEMPLDHQVRFIVFSGLAMATHETTIIPLMFVSLYYVVWKMRVRFLAFFSAFTVSGIILFVIIFKQWDRIRWYLSEAEFPNLGLMTWFMAYSMPVIACLTAYYGYRYYLKGVEYRGAMKMFLFSMVLFSFSVAGGGYIWSPWRFTALASIPTSIFATFSVKDLENRYPKVRGVLSAALILLNLVYVAPMLLNGESWIGFPNQPQSFSISYV